MAEPLLPAALADARRGGTDRDRYVDPTREERDAIREAIALLVSRGPSARGEASMRVEPIAFEIVDVPELAGTVVVRETEARRRGGGAYVVRFEARARDTAIQAPHTFFDEGTLPLAYELFERSEACAIFFNTSHRYDSSAASSRRPRPSDVAHNAGSIFQAATEGLVRAIRAPTIVQLHGFAAREDATTVVVSAGDAREGDELVARVASALSRVTAGVKRYPEESGELGATTNVQGEIVRAAGGRFLHVELAATLRKRLLGDAPLRAAFLDALAGEARST